MSPTIREQFDSTILKEYYHDRHSSTDPETMEIGGLRKRKEKFAKILDSDPEFYVLHKCANIAATWLTVLATMLVDEISESDNRDELLDEQVAGLAFFSRLSNDLWAIIELIEIGFDLQARALTRSYLEHVDVLICCVQDRTLTSEFVKAVEPEESNGFWHKYVSKNKAKARVSDFISSKLGREKSRIVDLLREDAEFAGSILLHPSVAAGLSTAFGHQDGDYDFYPIFPTPLAASVGIFRTILIHLLWLWFSMGSLPKYSGGEWSPLLRSPRLLDNKTITRLEGIYSQMFKFLIEHQLLMRSSEED